MWTIDDPPLSLSDNKNANAATLADPRGHAASRPVLEQAARRIQRSPRAVSTYAARNDLEDFADSVVVFADYAGRNGALGGADRRKLKRMSGKRFSVLKRLVHDRFPARPGHAS